MRLMPFSGNEVAVEGASLRTGKQEGLSRLVRAGSGYERNRTGSTKSVGSRGKERGTQRSDAEFEDAGIRASGYVVFAGAAGAGAEWREGVGDNCARRGRAKKERRSNQQ